jgi:hypothetical protein
LGYQNRTGHFKKALEKLDDHGFIAMTLPATPRSKQQKRRLTERGRELLANLGNVL